MRVLVADDDVGIRLVVRAVVANMGHDCMEAANGHEAGDLYLRYQPHVLVADRTMPPGPDGIELCRAVRGDAHNSYTYIVLLTSLAKDGDILAGSAAGADDYVVKPLDPFLLRTRLLVAERVTSLHDELGGYRATLTKQAHTDPLTGLNNRLKLVEDLHRLHQLSVRHGRDYSLALCDVDHFKRFNDKYGHQAGDQALQTVAAAMTATGRPGDDLYRYGGEEFLLLLPEQGAHGAAAACERLRERVQSLAIPHSGSPQTVLTISVGISSFHPGSTTDSEALLRQADIALYEAKAAGRNRVTAPPCYDSRAGMSKDSRTQSQPQELSETNDYCV